MDPEERDLADQGGGNRQRIQVRGPDEGANQRGSDHEDRRRANEAGSARSAYPHLPVALWTAAAISATNCGRRGPQREATSSLRPMIWWFLTAGSADQPGRAATTAGVWPPSLGWLSARKMICGLALRMYSGVSCGYPPSAALAAASATFFSP